MEAAKDAKAEMQDDEVAWLTYRQVLHAYTVMQPFVTAFVDGRFRDDGSIAPATAALQREVGRQRRRAEGMRGGQSRTDSRRRAGHFESRPAATGGDVGAVSARPPAAAALQQRRDTAERAAEVASAGGAVPEGAGSEANPKRDWFGGLDGSTADASSGLQQAPSPASPGSGRGRPGSGQSKPGSGGSKGRVGYSVQLSAAQAGSDGEL